MGLTGRVGSQVSGISPKTDRDHPDRIWIEMIPLTSNRDQDGKERSRHLS
jgi:hypothetical protein